MPTYRVPIVIKGYAILKDPDGKAAGDYTGELPADAEREVRLDTPFMCGPRLDECTVELAGEAHLAG